MTVSNDIATGQNRQENVPLIEGVPSITFQSRAPWHFIEQFTLWFGSNLQITAIVTGPWQSCLAEMYSGHTGLLANY